LVSWEAGGVDSGHILIALSTRCPVESELLGMCLSCIIYYVHYASVSIYIYIYIYILVSCFESDAFSAANSQINSVYECKFAA
jgi:hypothetical protein